MGTKYLVSGGVRRSEHAHGVKQHWVIGDLEQVDLAFAQLSEADQAYLLDVYQEDVFLNN